MATVTQATLRTREMLGAITNLTSKKVLDVLRAQGFDVITAALFGDSQKFYTLVMPKDCDIEHTVANLGKHGYKVEAIGFDIVSKLSSVYRKWNGYLMIRINVPLKRERRCEKPKPIKPLFPGVYRLQSRFGEPVIVSREPSGFWRAMVIETAENGEFIDRTYTYNDANGLSRAFGINATSVRRAAFLVEQKWTLNANAYVKSHQ